MATYCNAFKMETDENKFGFAQNPDSFESWQGRRGPYYTPVVSADGTLSWVNNGGLPNPQPVNIAGPPGQGLEIQGVVETVQQLPTGAAQGDVWLVGTDSPYEAYIWVSGGWLDLGQVAVGPQGPAGEPGTDGVSPEVTVTEISGGHRVTITDAEGTQTFDVMDGEDGAPGSPGAPGAPGAPGEAGVSPEVTVTTITGGHRVTITDADGTQTFDVMDGADGAQGATGPAGPGVAAGGTAGQILVKQSDTDYDAAWETRAQIVNPNLLDNWYFVGGGSQQGYGVFPVNQQEQTSYSNAGYTVDRWIGATGSRTTLSNDGMTVANTNSSGSRISAIRQVILNGSRLYGKTVTLSALVNNVLYSASATIPTSPSGYTFYANVDVAENVSLRLVIDADNSQVFPVFLVAAGLSVNVQAVKLELGQTQTLAHQESGVWVLNEIPDYATELTKCQAYLQFLDSGVRIRAVNIIANRIDFNVPISTPFATTPTLQNLNVTISAWPPGSAAETGFSFSVGHLSPNVLTIYASKTSHGLTDAKMFNSNQKLFFVVEP